MESAYSENYKTLSREIERFKEIAMNILFMLYDLILLTYPFLPNNLEILRKHYQNVSVFKKEN